jgi:crossover junction endodeoxyribonuclease RuvC
MLIMGIDPSLNCCGWFIFNTKDIKLVDYGYIPNTGDENEKLIRIYNTLSRVLDNYKVEGVGIEEEFFSRNVDTLRKLSHVHGGIILLLSQYNIPFTYYSVLTAKSVVLDGIKTKKADGTKKTGAEMKKEVADKVFEIFGRQNFIKDFTNDVTDAASIAVTYLKLNGKSIREIREEESKSKPKKQSKKDAKK